MQPPLRTKMRALRSGTPDGTSQIPSEGLRCGERLGLRAYHRLLPKLQGPAWSKIITVPEEEGGTESSKEVEEISLNAITLPGNHSRWQSTWSAAKGTASGSGISKIRVA